MSIENEIFFSYRNTDGKNVSPNLWCFLKNKGEIELAMQIDLLDRKRINTWLLNSGVLFQKWKWDPQK